MRNVQLHEARQNIATLLSDAEAGESLTILRGAQPVAQIIPFPSPTSEKTPESRKAAMNRLELLMKQGIDLGGVWNGRDELYDRD